MKFSSSDYTSHKLQTNIGMLTLDEAVALMLDKGIYTNNKPVA